MLIKDENRAKIEDVIKKAEGKATARTVTFRDIVYDVREIEKKLGILKKDMVGIEVNVDRNAQNFPNAYRYIPESTHYTIIRKRNCWDLVAVTRRETRREGHAYHLILTDRAKESLIEKYTKF